MSTHNVDIAFDSPTTTPYAGAIKQIPKSEVNKRITFHAEEHVKLLAAEGLNDTHLLEMLKNCFEVGAGLGVRTSYVPEPEGRDEAISKTVDNIWNLQKYEFLPEKPPTTAEEMELFARVLVIMKKSFTSGFVCGLCGSNALKGVTIYDDTFSQPIDMSTPIKRDEWNRFGW